jgi:hypothetical protein
MNPIATEIRDGIIEHSLDTTAALHSTDNLIIMWHKLVEGNKNG